MATSKPMKSLDAIQLRRFVTEGGEQAAAALTELERRRANLRGAVVPRWERDRRGPDYTRWAVV